MNSISLSIRQRDYLIESLLSEANFLGHVRGKIGTKMKNAVVTALGPDAPKHFSDIGGAYKRNFLAAHANTIRGVAKSGIIHPIFRSGKILHKAMSRSISSRRRKLLIKAAARHLFDVGKVAGAVTVGTATTVPGATEALMALTMSRRHFRNIMRNVSRGARKIKNPGLLPSGKIDATNLF